MNSVEYKKYIWQHQDWPNWTFEYPAFSGLLSNVHRERGRLMGAMQNLGFKLAEEATLEVLTSDVVKSSEIEGEKLDSNAVRSSLAKRLGLDTGGMMPDTRSVDGIVEVVLDATRNHVEALTEERLFGWHAALFPTGYSGMHKIIVGGYRDDATGPMQVVSGGMGHEKVHYQAPPADRLPREMAQFLDWFNQAMALDPVVKAGLAHLWFVTLHPFEDGNGRIGRAICDMALARADESPRRFYSLSSQIQRERKDYYLCLERAQKATLEVSDWLDWFLGCLLRAIDGANDQLKQVVVKANFWTTWSGVAMNNRQIRMLNLLLDGFDGNLNNRKWAQIAGCSPDTALRDINELVEKGVLKRFGGGRSTHYSL